MKYPILYVPTLDDQFDLIQKIYSLEMDYRVNGYKTLLDGWNSYIGCYVKDHKPLYSHVYVISSSVLVTTFSHTEWNHLCDDFLKVNSARQFVAYLKAHS